MVLMSIFLIVRNQIFIINYAFVIIYQEHIHNIHNIRKYSCK